MTEQEWETADG